ncbi:NB-ARC domain-containing protein [Nonomuraea sp. NPDC049419]|uniref:NB-ARC domain-containing protein n=1 Tax=Nonomuraea sp. NPDC049419 TaxID=3155772 RepID=UPI00341BA044
MYSARCTPPGAAGETGDGHAAGALLRGWRKRALLTQEQLAEKAGLNVRTVRRLESGGLQPRSRSVLLIAQALGLCGEEREQLAAAARGAPAAPADEPAISPIVPRQLPAGLAALAGREHELTIVENAHRAEPAPVVAVDGMAGTGKTALAVHAAHRLAPGFPDGQLYVDLHGHTPGAAPVGPAEALARMARALGVPGADLPDQLDDRAALYRSVLARRRVLVVLDDAADEDQIQPLLPAGPGCRVIVTSRRRLSGLGDVRALSLDVLPPAAAVALFAEVAGRERVAGAPRGELHEVVARCGALPLAVRIAAERLRARPTWRVRDLLDRLAGDRLAALKAGRHDVAAALDRSYDRLPADLRRAYRLLGARTGAGANVDPRTAATLLGTSPPHAERLLERLLDAHLLREAAPGRYLFHDLVRDHACRASRVA